ATADDRQPAADETVHLGKARRRERRQRRAGEAARLAAIGAPETCWAGHRGVADDEAVEAALERDFGNVGERRLVEIGADLGEERRRVRRIERRAAPCREDALEKRRD